MIYYLRKHQSNDGAYEYVSALDYIQGRDEFNSKVQQHLDFLFLVENQFNYYNNHSSTAFGNPDLAHIEGMIRGYCLAKEWVWNEEEGIVRVTKGKKTLFL